MGAAISKDIYDSAEVLTAILKSLAEDGILVIQVGCGHFQRHL
jgi:hypothetical protein